MKYYVTYKIDARYVAAVEADSLEEAMKKAEEEYIDADFGVAESIDAEQIIVEDENGNYIFER
jgi:phosphomannomutase